MNFKVGDLVVFSPNSKDHKRFIKIFGKGPFKVIKISQKYGQEVLHVVPKFSHSLFGDGDSWIAINSPAGKTLCKIIRK